MIQIPYVSAILVYAAPDAKYVICHNNFTHVIIIRAHFLERYISNYAGIDELIVVCKYILDHKSNCVEHNLSIYISSRSVYLAHDGNKLKCWTI